MFISPIVDKVAADCMKFSSMRDQMMNLRSCEQIRSRFSTLSNFSEYLVNMQTVNAMLNERIYTRFLVSILQLHRLLIFLYSAQCRVSKNISIPVRIAKPAHRNVN